MKVSLPPLAKGVFFAAIAGIMWALLSFALKEGFAFASPETLSWFRLSSSALLLLIWLVVKRSYPPRSVVTRLSPWLVMASLGLSFNYVGYAFGLEKTTPADAQMFIQMGPFLTTLLTFLMGREKGSWYLVGGFVTALIGFVIFYWDRSYRFFQNIEQFREGFWLIAGASFSWAIWAVIHRDQTRSQPDMAWVINLAVWTLCALFLTPFARPMELGQAQSAQQIMLLLFLSANTMIAYGCYALAYLYAPTALINIIVSMNPILVFFLTSEEIGWKSWLGGAWVTLGLIISFWPQLTSSVLKKIHRQG